MHVHLAAVCLSLAPLLAAIPLQSTIRSDNGVSGDASTASLSCGSQYISCCTDDSSVCNLAKGWNGDLVGGSVDFGNKTNHGKGANLNKRDFGLCQGNNNLVFCCGPPPSYQAGVIGARQSVNININLCGSVKPKLIRRSSP